MLQQMKIICFFITLILSCNVFSPFKQEVKANTGIERQVVVEKEKEVPDWKTKWDEVRSLVRQNRITGAAKGYSELLNMKSNIEEARWEYLQLLIRLKNWDLASNLVDSLIERNPQSMDYRLRGGDIALQRKEFERAIKYFGCVFNTIPNSSSGLSALEGLVNALQGLGRIEKALPLLEHMYVRQGHGADLLTELATMAMQYGLMNKAAHYYSVLIDKYTVDDRIVFQAANIHDKIGKQDKAVHYWKNYLKNHPKYLPFQKKISDYYLTKKESNKALPHLLVLLTNGENTDDLLVQIGKIYLHDQKRPDKALYYFQEYLKKFPDNKTIISEISKIQTVLANDFISIVENDGAWMLWKDLARLTPDRMAIYLSMVEALEGLGKEDEMYEIVKIIQKHVPDNQKALLYLSEIELNRGKLDVSIKYFNKVAKSSSNKKQYLLIQARIQEHSGNELSSLNNYAQYLHSDPENIEILKKCLDLSGRLGLVSKLKYFYQVLEKHIQDDGILVDIQKQYLTYLRENHFFTESEKAYDEIISKVGNDPIKTAELLFLRADFFYNQGLSFEAEQLLRRVLISNVRTKDALLKLIDFSLKGKERQHGWDWFSLLRVNNQNIHSKGVDVSQQDPEVTFMQAKLLSNEERVDEAISLLKNTVFIQGKDKKRSKILRKKTVLYLIWLYMKKGEYEKGLKLVKKVIFQYPNDLEARALKNRIRSVLKGKETLSCRDCSFSKLLQLARYELKFGGLKNGLKLTTEALKRVKKSVSARVLKAKLLIKDGQFEAAIVVFNDLILEFPNNMFFQISLLEIEFNRGNTSGILKMYSEHLPIKMSVKDSARGFAAIKNMILARSLLAVGQKTEALDVYNSMIHIAIEDMLVQKIQNADISVALPKRKKSFWDIITFSQPEKYNLTETVMTPTFVGKHLGKLIDIITTELYAEYRWQKLIVSEKILLQ